MYEFKRWGKHDYEIIEKYDYNTLTKRFYYRSRGMVKKEDKLWVAYSKTAVHIARTRKEATELLLKEEY
jgi:hypothetical protein